MNEESATTFATFIGKPIVWRRGDDVPSRCGRKPPAFGFCEANVLTECARRIVGKKRLRCDARANRIEVACQCDELGGGAHHSTTSMSCTNSLAPEYS